MNEKPTTNKLYQNVQGKIQQYCFIRLKGDKEESKEIPEFKLNMKINEMDIFQLKDLQKLKDEK